MGENFMVREGDLVAIFNSVHRVMQAEKLLKAEGLPILLIPVPRQLSSDCGLALRVGPGDWPGVEAALAGKGLAPAALYRREGEEYQRI